MKKLILSIVAIATIAISSFGQAPDGFKYQAVVRDAGNLILNNQAVGMRMTVIQGKLPGTAVYQETFATTTNAYGLVNLEIGSGTVLSGTFATMDWSVGPYFIETAVDVTGGTSYVVMGTSQLMSVPYALHAKTAENVLNDAVNDADFDPVNEMNTGVVLNGTDLEVTDGNGTIVTDLSSLQDIYTGGTGIDITGNIVSVSPSLLHVSAYVFQSSLQPGGEHIVKWSGSTTNPLAVVDADYTITDDTTITINSTGRYRVSYEVSCSNKTGGTVDNSVEVWLKEDTGFGIIFLNGTQSYLNIGKGEGAGASSSRSVIYDFQAGKQILLNLNHFLGDGVLNLEQHGCQLKIERIF